MGTVMRGSGAGQSAGAMPVLSAACQNMKKMALVLARKAEAALLRLRFVLGTLYPEVKGAQWPNLRFASSFL